MNNKTILASVFASTLALLPIGAGAANMKMKMNPAAARKALQEATASGAQLFAHGTFGSKRKMKGAPVTCETCHIGGGRIAGAMPGGQKIPSLTNAAAIFPHYNPMAGKVVTLETQVRKCVKGALGGKPPAYNSKAMTDMIAYLHSIAKGQAIDMGGKPK